MSIDTLLNETRRLMEQYPAGSLLWHRGCGRRGVLVGWMLYADGAVSLRVDYGAGGFSNELTTSMSAVPVSDGTAGDEWKDEGNQGAGR